MNIPVQLMQAEGKFSVPGTRHTVNREVVRRAIGRLPVRERGEVFDCFADGAAPSEKVAEALRSLIVEPAEQSEVRPSP